MRGAKHGVGDQKRTAVHHPHHQHREQSHSGTMRRSESRSQSRSTIRRSGCPAGDHDHSTGSQALVVSHWVALASAGSPPGGSSNLAGIRSQLWSSERGSACRCQRRERRRFRPDVVHTRLVGDRFADRPKVEQIDMSPKLFRQKMRRGKGLVWRASCAREGVMRHGPPRAPKRGQIGGLVSDEHLDRISDRPGPGQSRRSRGSISAFDLRRIDRRGLGNAEISGGGTQCVKLLQ